MKYLDTKFTGAKIQLDGNSFKKCVFEQCTLDYAGGKLPSMEDCSLNNSKLTFSNQAADTLSFLKAMYHGGFDKIVEQTFEDIKNKN